MPVISVCCALQARLCQAGRHMLYDYCAARSVAHWRLGKIIVAASDKQAGSSLLPPSQYVQRLCIKKRLHWQAATIQCRACTSLQVQQLRALHQNAHLNGAVDVRWISAEEARTLEPELHCQAALLSPSTGIVDGKQ